jgi:hypothetical protein
MPDIQPSSSRRVVVYVLALLFTFTAIQSVGAEGAKSADDAYLDGLQGEWGMAGTVLGKPVKYHARGERVLQGGFLRLHMIDTGAVPTYEAELFLGYDSHARDYVGHWLDRFGAAGARVVAIGKRDGDKLVIEFPYAEGTFRDTFVFDPKSHAWTLVIDSQASGTWSNFASYKLVHTDQSAAQY